MTGDAGTDRAATGPLANLRVLELATLNAGPTLGAMLPFMKPLEDDKVTR